MQSSFIIDFVIPDVDQTDSGFFSQNSSLVMDASSSSSNSIGADSFLRRRWLLSSSSSEFSSAQHIVRFQNSVAKFANLAILLNLFSRKNTNQPILVLLPLQFSALE